MSAYPELVRKLGGRTLLSLPCFAAAAVFFYTAPSPAWGILLSLPLALAGAVLLGPSICDVLAHPLSSLFYPGQHRDRPLPMYSVPQSKRAKGLYEEALAGFEKIAEDYPEETQPYLEMIDIAAINLRDPVRARAILDKGLARHADPQKQLLLTRMYEATLSRLDGEPMWLQQQRERNIRPAPVSPEPVAEPDGLTRRRFHPGGYERFGPTHPPRN